MVIQPGELRELWLPTGAKPNQSYMVKPSSKMRSGLVIAEGPAKIEKRKVKVYLTTEGDEAVRLRPMERVAELKITPDKDNAEQKWLREGRIEAFAEDAQALGPKVEHIWVNYQKRRALQERLTVFPKLQEVIEENVRGFKIRRSGTRTRRSGAHTSRRSPRRASGVPTPNGRSGARRSSSRTPTDSGTQDARHP